MARPLPSLLAVQVTVRVGEMVRTVSPGMRTVPSLLNVMVTGTGGTTSTVTVSVTWVVRPAMSVALAVTV